MSKKNNFIIFKVLTDGFFNSYSQIFFSQRKILSFIILIVTFFDFNAGLCGAIGVLASIGIAYAMGFNRYNIASGYYGFNSLLVSLGLGIYYNPNIELFIIVFFASFLTLIFTLLFEGVIGKYRVPYLSIPFLIAIWLVTLATREFSALSISQRGIYMLNEMYSWGGLTVVNIYNSFNNLLVHESIIIYFKSLGAIFFQYNVLAGFLLMLGLIIYSRQAFLLSVLGFASAYMYYHFIGANINELSYSYIGFNFILTAIAIGGFFIIPSFYSYLFVILLTPLISLLLTSTSAIFSIYQLSVFSLPFNIIVIVFLYILKFREYRLYIPEVVTYPKYSPEENLYLQKNAKARFNNFGFFPVELPVRGMWHISQGHEGEITHKDKWRHAWDFDITDDEGKTYLGEGLTTEDYFCFNKPVLAPADGVVEKIIDNVPDNEIGDVNTDNNWGNTIIIKHAAYLYSKICHLKANSFKVNVGDFVKKSTFLANSGNSGRSPEPHVHFQLQSTPFIGSDTLDYSISHYVLFNDKASKNKIKVKSYSRPQKDDLVSNIYREPLIYEALHFIPGQKIKFDVVRNSGFKEKIEWEVVTDIYNATYLYCPKTKSKAYLYNDGQIHYFTTFEGDRSSLLYYFYLGTYKMLMSFYKNMIITDAYPLHKVTNNILMLWIQDFIAPFYIFINCNYTCLHEKMEASIELEAVSYKTKAEVRIFNHLFRQIDFEFEIKENKIHSFIVNDKNKKIIAVCED